MSLKSLGCGTRDAMVTRAQKGKRQERTNRPNQFFPELRHDQAISRDPRMKREKIVKNIWKNKGRSMPPIPQSLPQDIVPQSLPHPVYLAFSTPTTSWDTKQRQPMCAGMLAMPFVQPQPLIHLNLSVFQAGHLPFAVSVSLRKPSSFNRIATLCLSMAIN